ncbi:MAG: phosphatidate cytidylyltransferase [Ginsengibacter sp.]
MAFDTKTFKTRTISAVIFAIVMLVGLLWNQWSFVLLFTFIHFGAWYEFVKLLQKMNPVNYRTNLPLGLFYISLPIVLFIFIRMEPLGGRSDDFLKVLPCGIILSIWINDTMAYITGSLIGKTPFSSISPKKTVEGTVGGIILSVLIVTILGSILGYYSWFHWLMISLISSVAGTLGDLLESKLKRKAGVKDSGNILPGHGGFLDRFDSLLVAIPFVFVYYELFIR